MSPGTIALGLLLLITVLAILKAGFRAHLSCSNGNQACYGCPHAKQCNRSRPAADLALKRPNQPKQLTTQHFHISNRPQSRPDN